MYMGFPGGASGKEPTCQSRRHKWPGFSPWVRKIPWRTPWQPTPVFLPAESLGQRSLAGYSAQSCKAMETTEGIWRPRTHIRMYLCVCVCSRHTALGISAPRPGTEPTPPVLEVWNPNHWTVSKVLKYFCIIKVLPTTQEVTHFILKLIPSTKITVRTFFTWESERSERKMPF